MDIGKDLEGGRVLDMETNLIFPWYTKPFLTELKAWDLSEWKVFEYGSGDSTAWWKAKAKTVYSVDSNLEWSKKTGAFFSDNLETFIKYPSTLIYDGKFDCIIIDGDPVEWRDLCTKISLDCIKNGGIIIIDNYTQQSVNNEHMKNTENLLKEKKCFIFNQPGHKDWKTAYWII
jgi:hypothetical protein